jgi:hypothetical protein
MCQRFFQKQLGSYKIESAYAGRFRLFCQTAQYFKKKMPDSLQWARFDEVIFQNGKTKNYVLGSG